MKTKLTIALTLAIANFTLLPAFAQLSDKPPSAPPPRGNPTPGGTFSGISCSKPPKPINALIPQKDLEPFLVGQGLTTSEHPTFWVYSPYSSEETITAKFSLHDRRGRALYRTTFNLPKTAGIIRLQAPTEAKYALEQEQFYHWYFSIQCTASDATLHDLIVDGWVKRVAVTPETEAEVNAAQPELWYDSLTRLANLRLASPQDEALKQDWSKLLTSAGLETLIEEPLLEPVARND
ncbi:DUF928 domain-containing protein [Oscillatoria sp. FACHB-1406]|uniref:DUF928 domain-containing protein n=1 Tax=Oscillatoria sp. FACHB-1406 TaxID=2692846 RepID=UPI00168A1F2B|nr:DUF928 domain-containing protein [Oscillatoria sp. FACHB-1406]MBD2579920.1 DUF928 domain-containing protein [Oscillatoria sp. FACHB-1406]